MIDNEDFDLIGFLIRPGQVPDQNPKLQRFIRCGECGARIDTHADTAVHTIFGWRCHSCYQ